MKQMIISAKTNYQLIEDVDVPEIVKVQNAIPK